MNVQRRKERKSEHAKVKCRSCRLIKVLQVQHSSHRDSLRLYCVILSVSCLFIWLLRAEGLLTFDLRPWELLTRPRKVMASSVRDIWHCWWSRWKERSDSQSNVSTAGKTLQYQTLSREDNVDLKMNSSDCEETWLRYSFIFTTIQIRETT